jgi:tetratricopeptide (TPR) repeat protein
MTQLPSDKYTIAWFKLAEFVRNKEKERALGIYRLLAHSLSDEAFAAQLEGDLLLAFNDDKAYISYAKAARLYEEQGKLTQAVAVYEHILTLVPEFQVQSQSQRVRMVTLYEQLGNIPKVAHHMSSVITHLLGRKLFDQAHTMLHQLTRPALNHYELHEQLVLAFLSEAHYDRLVLKSYVACTLDFLLQHTDSKGLTVFLAKVGGLDAGAYAIAYDYINQHDQKN